MCVKVNNLFACGVRVKPIFGTAFHKKGLLVLVNMSSHSLALSNTVEDKKHGRLAHLLRRVTESVSFTALAGFYFKFNVSRV